MTTNAPSFPDIASIATARLKSLEEAWNAADGAAFGTFFVDDCDFVDIRGVHHQSRAAVSAGHQALFDSIYRGSVVRYQLQTAREVTPGCLVVVAGATLDVPIGPAQGVRHSRFTVVLTEDGGAWSVTAFHNTLVQEEG